MWTSIRNNTADCTGATAKLSPAVRALYCSSSPTIEVLTIQDLQAKQPSAFAGGLSHLHLHSYFGYEKWPARKLPTSAKPSDQTRLLSFREEMSQEVQRDKPQVPSAQAPGYSGAIFEDPALSQSELQEAFEKASR